MSEKAEKRTIWYEYDYKGRVTKETHVTTSTTSPYLSKPKKDKNVPKS